MFAVVVVVVVFGGGAVVCCFCMLYQLTRKLTSVVASWRGRGRLLLRQGTPAVPAPVTQGRCTAKLRGAWKPLFAVLRDTPRPAIEFRKVGLTCRTVTVVNSVLFLQNIKIFFLFFIVSPQAYEIAAVNDDY